MKIKKIINQPEGRILEFKEQLPSGFNLARTIIAFSNDAGGEIYLGVKDEPREIVGLNPDTIIQLEERISSMVFDQCNPVILPEFIIMTVDKKAILRIKIFKGNSPPYFLKSKGKESGTYIRVGSSNRLASAEIVAELERQSVNRSFDSEIIFEKTLPEIDIEKFKLYFEERTGEELNLKTLSKLRLYAEINGIRNPTYAMILLSDDPLRYKLFPYAKTMDQKNQRHWICFQNGTLWGHLWYRKIRHLQSSICATSCCPINTNSIGDTIEWSRGIAMSKKEVFHSTVGQLVDLLKTLPQDLPVLTSGYENGFENSYQPGIIKVKHEPENPYYEGEFQAAEDKDEETFEAVVIRRVVRDE